MLHRLLPTAAPHDLFPDSRPPILTDAGERTLSTTDAANGKRLALLDDFLPIAWTNPCPTKKAFKDCRNRADIP